uniref:Uncharacterized protein n=1 Tax=Octopus bimaculoides TaxID=37653 RepID=A0A0L8H1C3_OCTBM
MHWKPYHTEHDQKFIVSQTSRDHRHSVSLKLLKTFCERVQIPFLVETSNCRRLLNSQQ